MNNTRWQVAPAISLEQLKECPELHPLIAQLIYNRGLLDSYQAFFDTDERLVHDPLLLVDMEKAADRILRAIRDQERIVIYGDFDADGVTATVLLVESIAAIGGIVEPYIPHRVEEGYGLNSDALKRLHDKGIRLVITVDCGITGIDEVKQANEMGMNIVVTDHHNVPSQIPEATAVVNPKRPDCTYPFKELAGVGVAYKLYQALYTLNGSFDKSSNQYLDLVALGTVADMVPLVNENRYLVKKGLQAFNSTERIGIKEMISISGLESGYIDSESISFVLAPRINSSARLDHAISSYKLLTTTLKTEAALLAQVLEGKNKERQRLTSEVLKDARNALKGAAGDSPLLMVGSKEYPSGVLGIVASRLSEEFYRPVIVLEIGNEETRGSARTIAEFNIINALTKCDSLLVKYGGHPRASGFTVKTTNIEQLKEQLTGIAAEVLADIDLTPSIDIDVEIPLSSINADVFQLIERLAPFGQGNPVPVFLSRTVEVLDRRTIGSNGDHLRFKLRDGTVVWDAVGFNLGKHAGNLSSYLDIVYSIKMSMWGNRKTLELNLLDFIPASLL